MGQKMIIALTFCAYIGLVLWLGWLAYQRTRNAADYFLGGRQLPPWVAALSAGASDTSGWLLIGLPGFAYAAGLEAMWLAVGLVIGLSTSWLILAKRLRVYSEHCSNALTLPVFLHRRFRCPNPVLRGIAAVFILFFFLFYVSSGLVAGAKLFNTVFELPYTLALLLGVAAIVSYTLFGGFLAVSWTDVLQGLLITVALVSVPVLMFAELPADSSDKLARLNPAAMSPWIKADGNVIGAIAIISSLGWGLGYFGQPHILARYKAIRAAKDVPLATIIAVLWSSLVYSGAVVVGILGIAFLPTQLADSEQVFMVAVELIFHPWIAGILLAAILAAIMSTADSQLLVCSSAFTEDIYRGFLPELGPKQSLLVGRIAVAAIAVLAFLIALNPDASVLDIVSYAWAGLGACLGPAILLSVYWRRMNWQGAFAGVVVGGLTVVVWVNVEGGLFDLYELVPGFILAGIAIVLVSVATPPPNNEIVNEFNAVQSKLVSR